LPPFHNQQLPNVWPIFPVLSDCKTKMKKLFTITKALFSCVAIMDRLGRKSTNPLRLPVVRTRLDGRVDGHRSDRLAYLARWHVHCRGEGAALPRWPRSLSRYRPVYWSCTRWPRNAIWAYAVGQLRAHSAKFVRGQMGHSHWAHSKEEPTDFRHTKLTVFLSYFGKTK